MTTASSRTSATPFVAATKPYTPTLRRRHLHRAKLRGLLISGAPPRVRLAWAAPGFGTTSLLSEWHADPRQGIELVSVDPEARTRDAP